MSTNVIIWDAKVTGATRMVMQSDGNLVVRNDTKSIWTSSTHGNSNAKLVIDDLGRMSVIWDRVAAWYAGIPRGKYTGP